MIDWERVKALICLKCEAFIDPTEVPLNDSLFVLFDLLYNIECYSWRQIEELTDGYVSAATLRRKAISLGIQCRPRGGPNNKRVIQSFDT